MERMVRIGWMFVVTLALTPALNAQESIPQWNTKAAFQPREDALKAQPSPESSVAQIPARDVFTFSAPPRGAKADELAVYQPIVDYISATTGKKFVYKHSSDWLTYSKDMAEGKFDLVFDGPHFNGWRQERLQHTPLVKLPEDFVFVVVARDGDANIKDVKNLAGRGVCAHAPPNLGTLTLLSRFDNPARQPFIVETQGWEGAYKALLAGKCSATVLPMKNLKKFEGDKKKVQVLYQHRALPNQAISAGPRITPDLQRKIAEALMTQAGRDATRKLLDVYAAKEFVFANRTEYAGLGTLLKDTLYYQ